MLELTPVRKNKVVLSDYNCQQDITNRILMADCSAFDLEVLEEILFSPLKISFKKLVRALDCKEEDLSQILAKLTQSGLLSLQEDFILVDKELRKYFEFQIVRFSPDFQPDMEFLSGLLRKVPIHYLPAWYAIPRTSNNIFESIVEKYLLTPQIYQRYLLDLNFGDQMIHSIMSDLFTAPDFTLYSSDVIGKYNLERRKFEEIMLLFEFNFVGCVSYRKEEDHWIEIITPYHEWHQYLRFLKSTEPPICVRDTEVERTCTSDFAFIEDMSKVLSLAAKKSIPLLSWEPANPLPHTIVEDLASLCSLNISTEKGLHFARQYLSSILEKLILIELACITDQKLIFTDTSAAWLAMTQENKALYLYRHNKNRILNRDLLPQVATERNVREAERSLKRVLHGNWVFFDDFFKGISVVLSEHSVIMLKKTGKNWKYSLPMYTDNERNLVKATIFEWLFETGMVVTGTSQGKDCFAVTPFGRFYFEE